MNTTPTETYKTSLDSFAIVATLICIGMSIVGIVSFFIPDGVPGLSGVALLVVFCYLYSTEAYILTDDAILLKRPLQLFNRKIMLADIRTARAGTKEDFAGALRTAANGGLFGYFGLFYSRNLGRYSMHSRNRNNPVVLQLNNDKIVVLGPDDPAFTDALNSKLLGQGWVMPK